VNSHAGFVLALLFALPSFAQQPASQPEPPDTVWTWSQQCGNHHKLGVTVRLGPRVLYRGVLLICRGSRDAENGRAAFRFAGGHFFQGEYRTHSTDSIEGDIWQAGAESDSLILGISFDTGRQILLNTLHCARLDRQTSSKLDKGLFITTYPIR
jgi:hypothetical protein